MCSENFLNSDMNSWTVTMNILIQCFLPAFVTSSISLGWFFLNSGVLCEEAPPPAVATLSVGSGVACVRLYRSSSPLPLPPWFPKWESPLFSSSFDHSHVFTFFLKSLFFPIYVCPSSSPFISPFLLFSFLLSFLISIPSSPSASDWQCYKLIFSPVCSLCHSLGISLI